MKLNSSQQLKIDVISQYLNGQLFSEDACAALRIKERQFRRIVKSFREKGIHSVLHGNTSKIPVNKMPAGQMSLILTLFKTRYDGLNLSHFMEKLHEFHFDKF